MSLDAFRSLAALPSKHYNVALAVQCEGNGHFTQAISIAKSLDRHLGLKVRCLFLNEARRQAIPKHFYDAFPNVPCFFTEGPIMIRSTETMTFDKLASASNVLAKSLGSYHHSLKFIDNHIRQYGINIVINLFDLMLVWYMSQYKPSGSAFHQRGDAI